MADPLVSIVTPTLNQGRYIEATLRSIRAQSYRNLEHIVVDGGSTDETLDVLRAYEGTYRMRWMSGPDAGMYDAINKGLKLASGDILAYLNSDDQYLPWSVELAVDALAGDHTLGLVYGHAVRIDDDIGTTPWLQPGWSTGAVAASGSIIQPTVFWRRNAMGDRDGFDRSLRYIGDLDMWLTIAPSANFTRIDEFMAIDHRHAEALSVAGRSAMLAESGPVRARHRSGPWATAAGPLVSRLRSAALRRVLWLTFVRATRRMPTDGEPFARSCRLLGPAISTTDALVALVPGQGQERMSRVTWRTHPGDLWAGDGD